MHLGRYSILEDLKYGAEVDFRQSTCLYNYREQLQLIATVVKRIIHFLFSFPASMELQWQEKE